ncbi:MAG: sulfatase/phosphatase domain-containing protein [Opitutales bacterium]
MKLIHLSALLLVSLASAAERPNILFIFSDDHALNAISAYNGPLKDIAPTPNLDRIAEQGAIFTRSYCTNSICGPSRAAILTGKHSHLNGYMDNSSTRFDGSQTTFPKLLQKVGYQTAIVGKWHLVTEPEGYDYWEILPGQGSYYNPVFIQQDGRKKDYTGYVTDIVTERTIDWLKNQRDHDKPFLLMAQHKAPHRNWSPALRHTDLWDGIDIPEPDTLFDDYANRHPSLKDQEMTIAKHFFYGWDMRFQGPQKHPELFRPRRLADREYERMTEEQKRQWDASYEDENQAFLAAVAADEMSTDDVTRWKYQRYVKNYLRCIRSVDEGVGEILDYLDKSGLAENTIVIYSSDQGFYLGEHGWYDKRWMFEESFAMPFLIRWPGVIEPGTRSEALIQNIDYAPTFLEIAGVEIPHTVQGRSLLPVLKNGGKVPEDWREGLYYFYTGELDHNVAAHDGVATDRYKLMYFWRTKSWNLFDLEKDPQEMNSVHDDMAYADVFVEMKSLYQELRDEYHVSSSTIPMNRQSVGWWSERHGEELYYFYTRRGNGTVAAHDGVADQRYKLMYFPDDESWKLFDLKKDPRARNSVYDDVAYADVFVEMKNLYQELRAGFHEGTQRMTPRAIGWWGKRHEKILEKVAEGGHELVFIGDSITQGWEGAGKEVWEEFYGDRRALNLGYSGDRTEHVIWRLLNGELEGVDPKAYVLMIGTNNTGHGLRPAEETADGIKLIVELLQDRSPESEILLLSVFPRGREATDVKRQVNLEINEIIEGYADGKQVHWLDLTDTFLNDQGTLTKEVMPDALHPREKGYRMWAEAMEPTLSELLN